MCGKLQLRILLVVVITGLVLGATLSVSILHVTTFERYARDEADRTLDSAAEALRSKTARLLKPAADTIRYVKAHKELYRPAIPADGRAPQFATFLQSVGISHRSNHQISGSYIAYADGSFVIETRSSPQLLQVANLPGDLESEYLRLERDNSHANPIDLWTHKQRDTWQPVPQQVSGYEPRQRPWYRLAARGGAPTWTSLYRFHVDHGYGMTLVAGLRDASQTLQAVVGVDVRLEQLTSFTKGLDLGPNGIAFIARRNGELLAHPALTPEAVARGIDKGALTLKDIVGGDRRDIRLFDALSEARTGALQINLKGETILARRMALGNLVGFDGELYLGASLADFTAAADRVANRTLLITGLIIALVVLVGTWLARAISRPVRDAANAMSAAAQLDLRPCHLQGHSALAEIATLNGSVNTMQSALRSFIRYVPRTVVRDLLELRLPVDLGGSRREVTILFTDIESFTTLAEFERPEALVDGLADYFDIIVDAIHAHGGTVDKFVGDSVMAIWGAPRDDAEHTRRACDAVVEIDRRLNVLNEKRAITGAPRFTTRYGIHRGNAFVGNIGARDRFSYTALGDVVNTAARLEGANKDTGTRALVSQSVVAAAGPDHHFAACGEIQLRGKSTPLSVHELVLVRGPVSTDTPALAKLAS